MSNKCGNNKGDLKPLPSNKTLNFNKKKHSDRLICDVCRKTYTRSAVTKHRQTNYHKIYKEMHDKFNNVLFNIPNDTNISNDKFFI